MADVDAVKALQHQYRVERKKLTLLQRPFSTLYLFVLEVFHLLFRCLLWLWDRKVTLTVALAVLLAAVDGLHRFNPELYLTTADAINISLYWAFLGFLSSFGLGTGLHTFILYLGPHIAHVTIAAYACDSTEFLPPFHQAQQKTWSTIRCASFGEEGTMTMLRVIQKVQFPAIMWGIGTAIGELPPYFMARAARLSGETPDDEDLEEFHESLKDESQQLAARMKQFVHHLVNKLGFWGILICASIPNPLFDLAGISCGHFLIPFWTFFGATAIGKGLIKMHLQMLSVVIILSESVFNTILRFVDGVPLVGSILHSAMQAQREKAKNQFVDEHHEAPSTSWFSIVIGVVIGIMFLYFAISIIEHLAQQNQQRKDKKAIDEETSKAK